MILNFGTLNGANKVVNDLEGATPLTLDDLRGLKFKHVTTKAELDQLEQANLEEGLLWLTKQKQLGVLTEDFLRTLHKKLFGQVWEWAGVFRRTEKNIGVDPIQISTQLRLLLDDTKYWIENEIFYPKEIAARFHHKLVYIHLFANGNGRHARIATDALLKYALHTEGVDWEKDFSLQRMNIRRSNYIKALKEADTGNFELLLRFVGA